jgi:hypothetical protein
VPAARQSILTIPLDMGGDDWPAVPSRIQLSEALLAALAGDRSPWRNATVDVDGEPHRFRVLTWPTGALWVGAYRDVTVSVIGYRDHARALRLVAMSRDELRKISVLAPSAT